MNFQILISTPAGIRPPAARVPEPPDRESFTLSDKLVHTVCCQTAFPTLWTSVCHTPSQGQLLICQRTKQILESGSQGHLQVSFSKIRRFCVTCAQYPRRPEEGARSLGVGVSQRFDAPAWVLGTEVQSFARTDRACGAITPAPGFLPVPTINPCHCKPAPCPVCSSLKRIVPFIQVTLEPTLPSPVSTPKVLVLMPLSSNTPGSAKVAVELFWKNTKVTSCLRLFLGYPFPHQS